MTTNYRRTTGSKWHSWCADCGKKNHKKASECSRCGYGGNEGDGLFLVKYKSSVGNPEYTSDGESGRYER